MQETKKISIKRERSKYICADYAAGFLAFLLFDIFRYRLFGEWGSLKLFLIDGKIIAEQFLVPFMMLGTYWLSGFYNRPVGKSRLEELSTTFFSSWFNAFLIYFVILVNDLSGTRIETYTAVSVLFILLFATDYPLRVIVTTLSIWKIRRDKLCIKVLVAGASEDALKLASRLNDYAGRCRCEVMGYLSLPGEPVTKSNVSIYSLEQVSDVCEKLAIDEIILIPAYDGEGMTLGILKYLFPLEIPIKIMPDTLSYINSSIRLRDIYGSPLIDLTSPTMSELSKNIKLAFDKTVSVIVITILSPLYLLLGILVKMSSPGPVFYSQERIGRRRDVFRIYKFRTMFTDSEPAGPKLSERDDPRVTRIGVFLRKYRLDELPQFWNVLRGDMSLVGPRPEREHYIKSIIGKAPYYPLLWQVRPGITSWGMVKYGYASTVEQMVDRARYDLIYLNNMSLLVDLKILLYTVKTILKGEGC